MFVDDAGEFRLLASIIDRPDNVLLYTPELFTGDRVRVFAAMRMAYLAYGDLSYEGVEQFYGSILPPELEAARGAKPGAIIDRLSDLALRRQISGIINDLAIQLNSRSISRDALVKKLQISPIITKDDSHLGPGVTTFVSDLTRKKDGKYRFVRTGLDFLDYMLGGEWPRSALTVVIGSAGSGKTALVVQSIINMARLGIPSLFISLEMPKHKIISRLVANVANIDGMKLRRGDITDDEQERVDVALVELQKLEKYIRIVDKPGQTIDEILYYIKLHKEQDDIQAFFVDYIQIIGLKGSDDTMAEILGYLAQQLRNAALNLDISGVVLSQQNRQFQGLSSILGSGRIAHIADSVFEIQMDTTSTNDHSRLCRLNFHKNRDGAVGEAHAVYRPAYLRFE